MIVVRRLFSQERKLFNWEAIEVIVVQFEFIQEWWLYLLSVNFPKLKITRIQRCIFHGFGIKLSFIRIVGVSKKMHWALYFWWPSSFHGLDFKSAKVFFGSNIRYKLISIKINRFGSECFGIIDVSYLVHMHIDDWNI